MENASKKRRQRHERNIKMFDQFIRKMRETDHRFSDQKTRNYIAPCQRVSGKKFNRSVSLSTFNVPFRDSKLNTQRQFSQAGTDGGMQPPPLSTKQADSLDPTVAWMASVPLTKTPHSFHFDSDPTEVPQALFHHHSAEAPSVEALQASAPTSAEAPKTTSSLAAVKEVEDEVDTPGPQDIQVMAAVEELGEGYHRTPDGYMEAEV